MARPASLLVKVITVPLRSLTPGIVNLPVDRTSAAVDPVVDYDNGVDHCAVDRPSGQSQRIGPLAVIGTIAAVSATVKSKNTVL